MFEGIIPGLISEGIAAVIGFAIGSILSNRKILKLYIQSLIRINKNLRLSTAYLFRIKDGNKYILVKGGRIEQYQPVGGVYKYYDSFNEMKKKMELVDETEGNFFELKDLRQKTIGKHLPAYIKWFESRKNREVNVYRELIEELEIPPDKESSFVLNTEIEYLETVKEKINYSEHFEMHEQLMFDIFEVRLPKEVIEILKYDERIIFVEEKDIRCKRVNIDGTSHNIAPTAKYII